jgi:hypothetical protein
MERRNSKQWINDLKIALINNDFEKIKKYSSREIPLFLSIKEAKEALHLVNEAKNILQQKKDEIAKKINSIKQIKQYSNRYETISTNNWKV